MRRKITLIAAIIAMICGQNIDTSGDLITIQGMANTAVTTNSISTVTKKAQTEKAKAASERRTEKTKKNKTKKNKTKKTEIKAERIRCTCYIPTGNPTASGVYPYEGIIASNREHLGQTAVLYTEDMELIGYFECKDTGGHEGLKNGTRIDVYRDTLDRAYDWVHTYGDYVYIEWLGVME